MEYAIDAAGPNGRFAVRCRGVTKTYGTGDARVMALRGIDLDVRRGELLMVVGPSGCGKTTLISVIAGILDQDSGQCEVLGGDLKHMGQNERARFRGLSIGFVFQLFNLLPALNAVENVSVPLLINGLARKKAESRAEEVLEAVSLGSRLDALPGKLSGGQQQRVAIARALIHEPNLIVCDEPTSNLDHVTGRSMMELLRDVAKSPDRALIVQVLSVGEMRRLDVDLARIELSKTQVATRTAEGQVADAKAALSAAIGIPEAGLDGAEFSWSDMDEPPAPESLSVDQVQRDAVLNRLDIRRSLAQYGAAEIAVQSELAKQYPNFNIGPGYTFEERHSFFTVGFSTSLPVFNRNQGPIAEAEGRRKEAAAAFLQTQAQVIARSERALAVYRAALKEVAEAQSLYQLQETQLQIVGQAIRAGADIRLSLDGVQIHLSILARARLDALARAQRGLGDLEDAVQRPLAAGETFPINPESLYCRYRPGIQIGEAHARLREYEP